MSTAQQSMPVENRKHIAIVGSGIAGLTAAFLLAQHHHVTIFEREDFLGIDSQGVNLGLSIDGFPCRVDSPPRSFSKPYYPHLMALYMLAGVSVSPFDWGYTLSLAGAPRAFLSVRDTKLWGWRLPSCPGEPWRILSLFTVRVIWDSIRYFRDVRRDIHNPELCALTVQEYLTLKNYCTEYVDMVFLPLYSMILTCSYDAVLTYPMDVIMVYSLKANSGNQYHVTNGSWDAAEKLTKKVQRIELGASVTKVHREITNFNIETEVDLSKPTLYWNRNGSSFEEKFDHIIMATQAYAALRCLSKPSDEEISTLSSFAYESSEVIVHRDESLFLSDKRDRNSINFLVDPIQKRCMATLVLPDPSKEGEFVYQSWNPPKDTNPSNLLKRIHYMRSTVTREAKKATIRLKNFQGRGQVWFVGAYALDQVPLQEQGVRSAVEVVESIGVSCPWLHNINKITLEFESKHAACSMEALYNCKSSRNMAIRSLLHKSTFAISEIKSNECSWMNFGYWKKLDNESSPSFKEACEGLALYLGNATKLSSKDGAILDVGCGTGNSLLFWKNKYNIKNVHGIEAVHSQVLNAKFRCEEEVGINIQQGSATALPYNSNEFSAVLSLDSAYHFHPRTSFFKEALRVLKPGGRLGVVDLLFPPISVSSYRSKYMLFIREILQYVLSVILCSVFHVPSYNFNIGKSELRSQLKHIGYEENSIFMVDITNDVLAGFGTYARTISVPNGIFLKFQWLQLQFIGTVLGFLGRTGFVECVLLTARKPLER